MASEQGFSEARGGPVAVGCEADVEVGKGLGKTQGVVDSGI